MFLGAMEKCIPNRIMQYATFCEESNELRIID